MKLIYTRRLAELIDNRGFQIEILEESMAASGITMEISTFKLLHKPMQVQPHQIITVSWMAEKENCLANGGLLADDCGTVMVRPCCAHVIYCSPH